MLKILHLLMVPNSTPPWQAQLRVATSGSHSDRIQMRGAGFLEGFLSAEQIHAHWHNMRAHFNLTSDAPVQW